MGNSFRRAVLANAQPTDLPEGVSPPSMDSIASDRLRSYRRIQGDRFSDRHRLVGEQAIAVHGGHDHSVDLVDLSTGGARIAGVPSPAIGDHVALYLGDGQPLDCHVSWSRDGHIGLEFAAETVIGAPAEQRDALLRAVTSQDAPELSAEVPGNPDPVAPPVEDAADLRAGRRLPLIWLGQLHYDHGSHPVRLRNISSTGALVDGAGPIPTDSEVMLDLGNGLTMFATLSWQRGDQAGLAFAEPFDIDRLVRARPQMGNEWIAPTYLAAPVRVAAHRAAYDNERYRLIGKPTR